MHRVWGFAYDEFLKLCDYVLAHYTFRIMPDWIDDSMKLENNPDGLAWAAVYPIATDLPRFWRIVHQYVERFFNIEYGPDQVGDDTDNEPLADERAAGQSPEPGKPPFMKQTYEERFMSELCKPLGLNGVTSRAGLVDVLAELICSSTGIHEHVGQISDYMFDPAFIGTRLQQDNRYQRPSVQNYSQLLTLTVLTGLRMPGLMEDWSHLIPRQAADELAAPPQQGRPVTTHLQNYHLFKWELAQRANEIDARHRADNATCFPFQSFNPRFMECSLSV